MCLLIRPSEVLTPVRLHKSLSKGLCASTGSAFMPLWVRTVHTLKGRINNAFPNLAVLPEIFLQTVD